MYSASEGVSSVHRITTIQSISMYVFHFTIVSNIIDMHFILPLAIGIVSQT